MRMTMEETDSTEVRLVFKPDLREEILKRMAVEWNGCPTLCLAPHDVQARWQLAPDTCAELLACLVDERVLERRRDGRYLLAGRR